MPNIYEALLENVRASNPRFETVKNEETDADYVTRLTQAVSGTTKEKFDAMLPEAQRWFDEAADALNEGKPVPPPEGYDRNAVLAQHPQPPAQPAAPSPIGRPAAAPVSTPLPPSSGPSTVVAPAQPANAPGQVSAATVEGDAQRAPTPEEDEEAPRAGRQRRQRPPRIPKKRTGPRGEVVHEGMSITTLIRRMVSRDYPADEVEVTEILAKLKEQGSDLTERRSTVATLRYDTISMLKIALEMGWQPPPHQQHERAAQ
jgi:hypothetical protein